MATHTIAPHGKHHHPSARSAALGIAGLGLALAAAFGINSLISGEDALLPGSGSQSDVGGGVTDFNGAPRYWEDNPGAVDEGLGVGVHPRQG